MLALIPSPNPYAVSVSESWMSFSSGNMVYLYQNYELASTIEFDFKPSLTAIHVDVEKWVCSESKNSLQSLVTNGFLYTLARLINLISGILIILQTLRVRQLQCLGHARKIHGSLLLRIVYGFIQSLAIFSSLGNQSACLIIYYIWNLMIMAICLLLFLM